MCNQGAPIFATRRPNFQKTMETKRKNKPGAGRPKRERPTVVFNFRIDADLHTWCNENRGKKSMTQFINDLIRKESKL